MANWELNWSKLIPFSKDNINGIDDNVAGVYRLSYLEGEDYYMFFVNETTDIKAALLEHLHNTKNTCIALKMQKTCSYKYSVIDNEDVRKAAVKLIYRHYQPTCNEVEPEGSDDITVNLT